MGTDLGVWHSTNDASTWQHVGLAEGLPYAPVFDLQLNKRTDRVVAFTHGRSAFALDLDRCTGDCNGDSSVTVEELVRIINIRAGNQALCMCAIGDTNRDGTITLDEQMQGEGNADAGCPD